MELAIAKLAETCVIAILFLYHMKIIGAKLDALTTAVNRRFSEEDGG